MAAAASTTRLLWRRLAQPCQRRHPVHATGVAWLHTTNLTFSRLQEAAAKHAEAAATAAATPGIDSDNSDGSVRTNSSSSSGNNSASTRDYREMLAAARVSVSSKVAEAQAWSEDQRAKFRHTVQRTMQRGSSPAPGSATSVHDDGAAAGAMWTGLDQQQERQQQEVEEEQDEEAVADDLVQRAAEAFGPHALGTQVLALVENATADELNRLLTIQLGSTPLVVRLLKRTRRPKLRKALLETLARLRLPELTLRSRAALVRALQQQGARLSLADMRAIANIFLSTRGLDLTKLKTAVNIGTGKYDLQRLIFHDIVDNEIRYELLQHFAVQAASCQHSCHAPQIITDYDDTIQLNWLDRRYPRKTVYPGVVRFLTELRTIVQHKAAAAAAAAAHGDGTGDQGDGSMYRMHAHGTVLRTPRRLLPILESIVPRRIMGSSSSSSSSSTDMESEADSGAEDEDGGLSSSWEEEEEEEEDYESDVEDAAAARSEVDNVVPPAALCIAGSGPDPCGGVVVLTARPAGVQSMVKRHTVRHLAWLGLPNLTVLTGSLLRATSTEAIVRKKFQNFQQFRFLFPEHRFVLVGDSGQGDAAFASLVLEHCPEQVLGAFIHDVKPGDKTGDGGLKSEYKQRGIVLFDTYVGAAAAAAGCGSGGSLHGRATLFDAAAVRRVAAAALEDLAKLRSEHGVTGGGEQGATVVGAAASTPHQGDDATDATAAGAVAAAATPSAVDGGGAEGGSGRSRRRRQRVAAQLEEAEALIARDIAQAVV